MTADNAKEIRCVVLFLSVLGLIVLGSFIVEKNLSDILYLIFILSCLVRYLLICHKN